MSTEPSQWQIAQALACYQSLLHEQALTDDAGDLESAIEAGEQDVLELLRRVVRAIGDAEATSDAVKARIVDLEIRRQRYDARREALRRTAFAMMDALGKAKHVDAEFTLTIGKPRAGLVITDDAEIPDEYMKTIRQPDKAKLLEDLKEGVVITGAELANGMPTLTVRTK